MDLSFFRRAMDQAAGRTALALDHHMLVAALRGYQSNGATARAEGCARALYRSAAIPAHAALVELLSGGPAWREAIVAQHACFSPRYRGLRLNPT